MRRHKISHKKNLLPLLLISCVLFGCSSGANQISVHIQLQTNGSLIISGPDSIILKEIQRDSVAWQNVFPVYRMPADTDMKDFQAAQPGKYVLKDGSVIFSPDTPFIQGRSYFLRYFHYGEGGSTWNLIKNHQKLGTQAHTDLTFKK